MKIKDFDKICTNFVIQNLTVKGNRPSYFVLSSKDESCHVSLSPIEFLLWCGIYQLSLCTLNPVDHMQSNIIFVKK